MRTARASLRSPPRRPLTTNRTGERTRWRHRHTPGMILYWHLWYTHTTGALCPRVWHAPGPRDRQDPRDDPRAAAQPESRTLSFALASSLSIRCSEILLGPNRAAPPVNRSKMLGDAARANRVLVLYCSGARSTPRTGGSGPSCHDQADPPDPCRTSGFGRNAGVRATTHKGRWQPGHHQKRPGPAPPPTGARAWPV